MKFGEYLRSQKVPEWQEYYLDYDKLKDMIKKLEEIHLAGPTDDTKATSLSIPRPTNAAGMPTEGDLISQEQFYVVLEQEMRKIEKFTKTQVDSVRSVMGDAERQIAASLSAMSEEEVEILKKKVENAGEDFLKLEKFVNLNFMGFHKILKKHDRRLPNPCKAFYTARLHDQSWVRGDYSDVMVSMSRVYSKLRGDEEKEANENAKQDFVRSTRKYWVHTEDISTVKYIILQHLPVFLQKTMVGETDSQLVNSVYIDNAAMELYQGRLEKSPGAIALRFRWYGTGTPELVFVERKTHQESWTGDVSVKERFTIKENQVQSLLAGEFDFNGELQALRRKNKSEEDIKEWSTLAGEVIQAINSKQLIPTMRTQYMRTAFQIPFDATVRVSLDTNLTMISERTKDTLQGKRWYRDPNTAVPLNEITRFPHGVLEIKLQLDQDNKAPQWVTSLLESGKLLEVHKFSKFIHGCAVLMPDDVRAVPYWIDDVTLADSITRSGASKLLEQSKGINDHYKQLLPHDSQGQVKGVNSQDHSQAKIAPAKARVKHDATNDYGCYGQTTDGDEEVSSTWYRDHCAGIHMHSDDIENGLDGDDCCDWTGSVTADHMTIQKVEPKLVFANERTFISWMQMAVMMSSISIGILAFSSSDGNAHYGAMIIMPIAIVFIVYASRTYLYRMQKITSRDAERWDDPFGPVVLTCSLILALTILFFLKVMNYSFL